MKKENRLIIDLSEIENEVYIKETINFLDELAISDSEISLASPMKVFIRIKKKNRVRVELKLEGSLKCRCVRCLDEFSFPFQRDSTLYYSSSFPSYSAVSHELKEEELDELILSSSILDLKDVLYQEILSVLPLKPLCNPECRGLCQVCGTNKNKSTCIHF